ncbi:MAG: alpha/beta hydrolase [Betaproteobacteria bacterium]|nr:alpha/beta hydrolase [Betaproteobacteria bacterium]
MQVANIEGIKTRYWVTGEGPPLLLLSPMGFDAAITHRWFNRVWRGFKPIDVLVRDFRVIAFDRRECGESGGRVEPLSWGLYARHARGLLDHLEIENAYVLSACIGCSVGLALAADFPERCRALMLHWPVGGVRWLARGRTTFDRHCAFAREQGLAAVAGRARRSGLFWSEPEAGPWASVLASDEAFAEEFVRQDLGRYLGIVAASRDRLFWDVLPAGATSEQLAAMRVPAFIMSGDDALHAMSSAHVLRELIPQAKLSTLAPPEQNAAAIEHWVYESTGVRGTSAAAA